MKLTLAIFTSFAAACVHITAPMHDARACDVSRIDDVLSNPLLYSGKWFCGNAFVVLQDRTVRVLAKSEDDLSNDIVLIVTNETTNRLGPFGERPKRYYLEAMVDPMAECFSTAENGEECTPY